MIGIQGRVSFCLLLPLSLPCWTAEAVKNVAHAFISGGQLRSNDAFFLLLRQQTDTAVVKCKSCPPMIYRNLRTISIRCPDLQCLISRSQFSGYVPSDVIILQQSSTLNSRKRVFVFHCLGEVLPIRGTNIQSLICLELRNLTVRQNEHWGPFNRLFGWDFASELFRAKVTKNPLVLL